MDTVVFATVFLLSFWAITVTICYCILRKQNKELIQQNEELLGASKMLAKDYRDCLLRVEQTDCDHKCIQTEIGCEQTDCPWK